MCNLPTLLCTGASAYHHQHCFFALRRSWFYCSHNKTPLHLYTSVRLNVNDSGVSGSRVYQFNLHNNFIDCGFQKGSCAIAVVSFTETCHFLCSASSRPKNHIYLVFRIYLVFLLGPSCLHAVIFPYSLNPFMIKMCNPLTCNATLGGGKLFWTVFLYSFYRLMNYFTRLDALFNLDLLVRCQLT